jgi:gas vesicle protein
MGNRRKQGNMTPQKANNQTIEYLMDSVGDETLVSKFKGMIRIFKEFKRDIQKQVNEFQENTDKKLKKVQKQLNKLKEDINKALE